METGAGILELEFWSCSHLIDALNKTLRNLVGKIL